MFDERNFVSSSIAGVRMKTLSPIDNDAKKFQSWLESGIFEALEKRYVCITDSFYNTNSPRKLKKMTFGVYKDAEGKHLLEQYDFMIQYNKEITFDLEVFGFKSGKPSLKTKETITQGIF